MNKPLDVELSIKPGKVPTLPITKKTCEFRIKRNGAFCNVLQQWNQYVDKPEHQGFWSDVPIVYTDDNEDFKR